MGTTHLDPRTVYIARGVDFSNTITHTGYIGLGWTAENGDRLALQLFTDTLSNDRFVSYGYPGSYRTQIGELRLRYDARRAFLDGRLTADTVAGGGYRLVRAAAKESFNSGVIALDRRDISAGPAPNDIIDSPFSIDPPGTVGLGWENDVISDTTDAGLFLTSDATWRDMPPMGCVLRCIECPPVGGDTMWANMALAYENLPAEIKTKIADLRARHSIEASFGAAMPVEKRLALHAQFPDAEHPVVRTHPETGEKILFVNAFTTHFTNFHTAQNVRYGQDYTHGGSDLLRYLVSQASIPEYQVRFRWKPNSMAMWDNRSTQHYAVMDYPPCHRKMERAGIMGDTPF